MRQLLYMKESFATFTFAEVRSPTSTGSSQRFSLSGNKLGCGNQYMVIAKAELFHNQKLTLTQQKGSCSLVWPKEQEVSCPNVYKLQGV